MNTKLLKLSKIVTTAGTQIRAKLAADAGVPFEVIAASFAQKRS